LFELNERKARINYRYFFEIRRIELVRDSLKALTALRAAPITCGESPSRLLDLHAFD
jgi:hypothetical protein